MTGEKDHLSDISGKNSVTMPNSKLQKQKATSEVKLTKAKDFRFEVDEVQVDSETEELPVLEESESEQGPK